MDATRFRLLRLTEVASWTFGLVGLLWWGSFQAGAATSTRQDLERFAALRVASEAGAPDRSLSVAWTRSGLECAAARVRTCSARRAPHREDSSRSTRVARHRRGHAGPRGWSYRGDGSPGHRRERGHCRPPRQLFPGTEGHPPGDLIEIDTLQESYAYRVERMWVVDPTEVSVLAPTPGPALTLVTCFPFDFIGSAPVGSSSVLCLLLVAASQVIAESAQQKERVMRSALCRIGPGRGVRRYGGDRVAGAADVNVDPNEEVRNRRRRRQQAGRQPAGRHEGTDRSR